MKTATVLLATLLIATVAQATPPLPIVTMQVDWRSPDTLIVKIAAIHDISGVHTLIVQRGSEKVAEMPVTIPKGEITIPLRVAIPEETVDLGIRVMGEGEGSGALLSDRVHIRREGSETRLMSRQEVEAMYSAEREKGYQAAMREREAQLRRHVKNIIARGGKPVKRCEPSEDDTYREMWNRILDEELGEKAGSCEPSCH